MNYLASNVTQVYSTRTRNSVGVCAPVTSNEHLNVDVTQRQSACNTVPSFIHVHQVRHDLQMYSINLMAFNAITLILSIFLKMQVPPVGLQHESPPGGTCGTKVPPVGLVAVKVEWEDGNKTSLCPLCLNRYIGSLTMRPFKGKSNHRSVTGVASSHPPTLLTASHTSPTNFYFNFHQVIHRKNADPITINFSNFFVKKIISLFSKRTRGTGSFAYGVRILTWGSRG